MNDYASVRILNQSDVSETTSLVRHVFRTTVRAADLAALVGHPLVVFRNPPRAEVYTLPVCHGSGHRVEFHTDIAMSARPPQVIPQIVVLQRCVVRAELLRGPAGRLQLIAPPERPAHFGQDSTELTRITLKTTGNHFQGLRSP